MKRVELMSEQNQTPDWREALLSIWNKPILKNMRFIFNIAYSVLKNIFVIAILALMLNWCILEAGLDLDTLQV